MIVFLFSNFPDFEEMKLTQVNLTVLSNKKSSELKPKTVPTRKLRFSKSTLQSKLSGACKVSEYSLNLLYKVNSLNLSL